MENQFDNDNTNPTGAILDRMMENLSAPESSSSFEDTSNDTTRCMGIPGAAPLQSPVVSTVGTVVTAEDAAKMQSPRVDDLQRILQPEVLNPQMKLQTMTGQKQGSAVASSVAQAVKQSADSNQEEYGTVGRTAAVERIQDMVLLASKTTNSHVYEVASTHLDTALNYAKAKGAIASHEAMAKNLTDSLNGLNGMRFIPYTVESFKEQSGHIYTETLRSEDGKLHVTMKNSDGGYHSRESVSLNTKIGDIRADELVGRIGQYHTQDALLERDMQVLTSDAFISSEGTTASWEHLVGGNYGALDDRLSLTKRYNEALDNRLQEMKERGTPKNILEEKKRQLYMRAFHGTKDEVERLREMKDHAGRNIFSEDELKELDECVEANGYYTNTTGESSLMVRRAAAASKRRIARNMLENAQATGMSTMVSAYRAGKTAKDVTEAAADVWQVKQADRAEKQVQKLVNRLGDEKSSARQLERAKARLEEKRKKLGLTNNSEVLGKMKERSERARDIKEKKKELRRMTRGMDKTQTRIALNELRQQERLSKHGRYSKSLAKRGERLQAKLSRQRRMQQIRNKIFGTVLPKHSRLAAAVGHSKSTISRVSAKAKRFLLLKLLPILRVLLLIYFLIAGGTAMVTVLFAPFIEENGNTDDQGKVMNDLELVNRGMSEHEEAMQAELETRITQAVIDEYTATCGSCGYSILPIAAGNSTNSTNPQDFNIEFDIRDEFGNPASICNCMQIVSLYRYYYLFMDNEDEAEDSSFWLNDFKNGRMMDAWDRTHYVSKTVRGKDNRRKWSDSVTCADLTIDYETYPVYHSCGDPPSTTILTAYKIVKVTVPVCVDSKLETIAQGNKLRTMRNGAMNEITWQEFEEEGTCDNLNDLLGTYEELYQQGYETYADFEVYFGNTADMMSEADIAKVLQMIADAGYTLSEEQTAVITTGLTGCGKFSYSMAAHGNSGKGVQGGATDCSGFMSWIHNNCGLYSNTSLSNTTTTWSLAAGHKANNVASLKPGDLVVKGAPGEASASEGNSNHVVMFIGILTDPDTGHTSPWIIECGGSARNSHVKGDATKIYNYKTAVPLGSSDTW